MQLAEIKRNPFSNFQFIATFYNEDPNKYSKAIFELEQLRTVRRRLAIGSSNVSLEDRFSASSILGRTCVT